MSQGLLRDRLDHRRGLGGSNARWSLQLACHAFQPVEEGGHAGRHNQPVPGAGAVDVAGHVQPLGLSDEFACGGRLDGTAGNFVIAVDPHHAAVPVGDQTVGPRDRAPDLFGRAAEDALHLAFHLRAHLGA